jgi:archaellum component FlaC
MAGRPVASSGQSGLLYWVIAFAVLTVVMLGLFILQLTTNKDLAEEAEQAQRRLSEYGNAPSYYRQEASARSTNIFAAVDEDHRMLATLISGSASDVPVTLGNKLQGFLDSLAERYPNVVSANDTLITVFETMSDRLGDQDQTIASNESRIEELEQQKQSLTAQLRTAREEFEQEIASLKDRLAQIQDDKTRSLAQKDNQLQQSQDEVASLRQQVTKFEREWARRERDVEIMVGRLERQVERQRNEILSLKPEPFNTDAILTKADGRVFRSVPGSDIIYVNLGAQDNVKVGMGFEVFSESRTDRDTLRGKASLEVEYVMADSAECRVTRRLPGKPIVEGDFVVNLAYERERQPKVLVLGDFDLDYDGQIDFDGKRTIESLVRKDGGMLVEELDESVDYIVIGLAPRVPQIGPDGNASDVVKNQAVQQELEASRFRDVVDQAGRLRIPIVTQNQYLFLTGYSGRGAIERS